MFIKHDETLHKNKQTCSKHYTTLHKTWHILTKLLTILQHIRQLYNTLHNFAILFNTSAKLNKKIHFLQKKTKHAHTSQKLSPTLQYLQNFFQTNYNTVQNYTKLYNTSQTTVQDFTRLLHNKTFLQYFCTTLQQLNNFKQLCMVFPTKTCATNKRLYNNFTSLHNFTQLHKFIEHMVFKQTYNKSTQLWTKLYTSVRKPTKFKNTKFKTSVQHCAQFYNKKKRLRTNKLYTTWHKY